MFRVVPDQLRVSDGWVRCGQCDEVFDASAHLHTELTSEPVTPAEAVENTDGLLSATLEETSGDAEQSNGVAEVVAQAVGLDPPPPISNWDPVRKDPFLDKSALDSQGFANAHDGELSRPDAFSLPPGENGPVPKELNAFPLSDSSFKAASEGPEVSFMRGARSPSVWRRPLVRVVLSLVCLLLCFLLLVQVVVQERDRIAAGQSDAKAFLKPLCAALSCTISPMRQIESVVIDSSSFSKVRSDVFRLQFTLRNSARVDVATPAVELTLTDLQDQSVVRRVFKPDEFGAEHDAIPAGSELAVVLPVSVKLAGNAERFAGYRLLAFYP
jgi:predicted Zn finger-like uncharacterized protein